MILRLQETKDAPPLRQREACVQVLTEPTIECPGHILDREAKACPMEKPGLRFLRLSEAFGLQVPVAVHSIPL